MDCKSAEREIGHSDKLNEALGENKLKILSSFGEKSEKVKLINKSLKNSSQDHKKITITLSPNYRAEAETKNSLIKVNNLVEKDYIQNSINPFPTEIQNSFKLI